MKISKKWLIVVLIIIIVIILLYIGFSNKGKAIQLGLNNDKEVDNTAESKELRPEEISNTILQDSGNDKS